MPNVKNATSYFENGLKNRFRAIEFRADDYRPNAYFREKLFWINIITNLLKEKFQFKKSIKTNRQREEQKKERCKLKIHHPRQKGNW